MLIQFIGWLILTILAVFPALGKDYGGTLMAGGFQGWGLDIAATAVVCMSAITKKYKENSTKVFVISPLCEAVLLTLLCYHGLYF